ncbi:hypothetical protein AB0945_17120 [Streptomyces sp. NPDC005474]|uniref:hypothetical protein n=1 Tax=Streptomyces sp. NPDC005474 TaxID=3154878 RepID=UPI003456C35E
MKRRPTLLAAISLTAIAALSLSACGSDDNPDGNDKIAGADVGDGRSTMEASTSPSPSQGIDRPSLSLPNDVKEVFEDWKIGDPIKDAVLTDAGHSMTAVNRAITDSEPDSPALSFYYEGTALVDAVKWVQTFVDHDATVTGTTRYYSPTVTLSGKKSAVATLCADESKIFNKFLKTNKVDRTTPSDNSYVYYLSRLNLNSAGVWVTTEIDSKRGSKQCTP